MPYQTPKEDLFQRATSFQDSIEEAFKSDYNTDDVSSHPDYRKELQSRLSTYYEDEDVLGMKGASGVVSTRPLALRRTPQKPTTDPRRLTLRRRSPLWRTPHGRIPRPPRRAPTPPRQPRLRREKEAANSQEPNKSSCA